VLDSAQVLYKLFRPVIGFDRLEQDLRELPVGTVVEMSFKPNEIGLVWALWEGRSVAVFADDVECNGMPTEDDLGEAGV
jgi:hypothetical protein